MRASSEDNDRTGSAEIPATTTNRAALRAGGIAVVIAGLGGIAWFTLELLPPVLGFDDTDNPAVSLDYLRRYPQFYALAGVVLVAMALAFVVASVAVSDALAPRASSITRRSLSALGVLSAAFLFMHGVLRLSVGPLLYIDGMNSSWGESAYLTIQTLGIHGFAQASLLSLGVWTVGISVAGARSRALPIWLCVLGIVTGLRLVVVLAGPILMAASIDLPEVFWFGSVALIPLAMLWWLGLGVVLLVTSRPIRAQKPDDSVR
ncbi:hypothetical protein RCH12_002952 [Cryobacterium sp. MP_3.1]|uniref:hypothetical protein n=1 Tax=Cryobacterium sp. MP_3.1 TaxID=3071711 RepID=UPI002DFF2BD2|nr:hypothetical protein [Cryobacterium sp. MP_3.1]